MDHSSAFAAAVITDNDDDDEDGRHNCYFCFLLPGSQNRSIIRNRKSMEALGFGSTMLEFQDLVKDFEEMKSIKTRFTDNRPGYDWVQSFLKWHKLSFKKGEQMQLARKNVMSDPFVVYGHYEILKKEIQWLGIKDKPELFTSVMKLDFPKIPQNASTLGQ